MSVAVDDASPELIRLPDTFISILFGPTSSYKKSIQGNGNSSGNEGSDNLIANGRIEHRGRKQPVFKKRSTNQIE